MDKFTEEELTVLFELAHAALVDGNITEQVEDDLELPEDYLKELRKKLEKWYV